MNVEKAIKEMQFLQTAYERLIEKVSGEPDDRYERYVDLQSACCEAEKALSYRQHRDIIPHRKIEELGYCPSCGTELCVSVGEQIYCSGCGQAVGRQKNLKE